MYPFWDRVVWPILQAAGARRIVEIGALRGETTALMLERLRPGTKQVLPKGGINPLHYNAVTEGGPRNGVMTALDDFVAEYDKPLRVLVLPVYFGLAIVVEEARLASQPELARLLDRFESAEGKDDLLQIAESTRLQAILFQ